MQRLELQNRRGDPCQGEAEGKVAGTVGTWFPEEVLLVVQASSHAEDWRRQEWETESEAGN